MKPRYAPKFGGRWLGLGGLILFAAVGWAHEDPRGVVRPQVRVEGSAFIVEAGDNTTHTGTEIERVRQTYDAKGKLQKEERSMVPVPRNVPYEGYSFLKQLGEDASGLERAWGERTLVIPEWSRKHGGQPYLFVHEGGKFTYHKLAWAQPDVDQVVDAVVSGDELFLLVTREDPTGEVSLHLHRFSLLTFTEVAGVELPRPACIYTFPVCSNVIFYKGSVYLGVVEPRVGGVTLVLASWDGVAPDATRRNLTKFISWNTSLSLAHIGDDALISYHHVPWGWLEGWSKARIYAIPFKLK